MTLSFTGNDSDKFEEFNADLKATHIMKFTK